MTNRARRSSLVLAPAVLALGLAACGNSHDITGATDTFNKALASTGVKLDCPDTVDGGEGTTFNCTVIGRNGSKQTVAMKIVKENGELKVDPQNTAQFKAALVKASGQ
jgi:ABC-type glycerol-3-phosphate transport system substrate-binding protein